MAPSASFKCSDNLVGRAVARVAEATELNARCLHHLPLESAIVRSKSDITMVAMGSSVFRPFRFRAHVALAPISRGTDRATSLCPRPQGRLQVPFDPHACTMVAVRGYKVNWSMGVEHMKKLSRGTRVP